MLSERRCISGGCRCGGGLAELHALSAGLTSKIESGVSATASTSTAHAKACQHYLSSQMRQVVLLVPLLGREPEFRSSKHPSLMGTEAKGEWLDEDVGQGCSTMVMRQTPYQRKNGGKSTFKSPSKKEVAKSDIRFGSALGHSSLKDDCFCLENHGFHDS